MTETGPKVPAEERLAPGRTDPQLGLTIDECGVPGTKAIIESGC
jgi:hypothetical protein